MADYLSLLAGIQEIREETQDQLNDLSTTRMDDRADIRFTIDRLDFLDELEALVKKQMDEEAENKRDEDLQP